MVEAETHELYEKLSGDIYSSWLNAIKVNNILGPIIQIISAVGTVLVYWFGVKFIDDGTVTVGILIAFISYIGRFWQPITNLSNFYNNLLMAMASIEQF